MPGKHAPCPKRRRAAHSLSRVPNLRARSKPSGANQPRSAPRLAETTKVNPPIETPSVRGLGQTRATRNRQRARRPGRRSRRRNAVWSEEKRRVRKRAVSNRGRRRAWSLAALVRRALLNPANRVQVPLAPRQSRALKAISGATTGSRAADYSY